ncbi:phosphonate ABC transporter ATP-binding protein [Salmonella enterica subsp. enterica]|nr:phosphonate ABC transporter ATP-binding protein [Salmonella enterica subsp. enterica]
MLMKTTAVHTPASQGTSGIVLDSLRVAYHGNVVLKPLSLTIEPGEVAGADWPIRIWKNDGAACGLRALCNLQAAVF